MAAPVSLKDWQSAVRLLDDLTVDLAQCYSKQKAMDPHKLQPQTSKLTQLVQAVTDNPVSAATAKKLVQSQVPYDFAVACRKVLKLYVTSSDPGSSGSTSSQPDSTSSCSSSSTARISKSSSMKRGFPAGPSKPADSSSLLRRSIPNPQLTGSANTGGSSSNTDPNRTHSDAGQQGCSGKLSDKGSQHITTPATTQATAGWQHSAAVQLDRVIRLAVHAFYLLLGCMVFMEPNQHAPTAAACSQQVQRSGLMQLLPQALSYSTEHLTATRSSSASGSSSSSTRLDTSSSLPGSCSSSAARSSSTAGTILDGLLLTELTTCNAWLRLFGMLVRLWPTGTFAWELAPDCAEPVLQAVLAVFTHVSYVAEQQGLEHAASLLPQLMTHWEAAAVALWSLCQACHASEGAPFGADMAVRNTATKEKKHPEVLLKCPSLLSCVTLDMATSIYAVLLLQRQRPGFITYTCTVSQGSGRSGGTVQDSSSGTGHGSSSSGTSQGRRSTGSMTGASSSSSSSSSSTSAAQVDSADSSSSDSFADVCGKLVKRLDRLGSTSTAAALVQSTLQMLADLPTSHNKLFALLGCDSTPLLLVAAAKAEQLTYTGSSGETVPLEMFDLRGVKVYEDLADYLNMQEWLGLHKMQQRERLPHYLMPALLLHIAAKQFVLPPNERCLVWEQHARVACQAAAGAVSVARGEGAGSYLPIPADLQQGLLQELLPMVVQISTAVLGLPGLAAYAGSCSGSGSFNMQSSAPIVPDIILTDSMKFLIAFNLTRCVCCAAHSCADVRVDPGRLIVPAVVLGSHVLMVGQLFEAAARLSQQAARSTDMATGQLKMLSHYLASIYCINIAGPGRLLDVAGSVAAADAAGISAAHARLQLASWCCSMLKVAPMGSAVAATPAADLAYSTVASAMTAVIASLSGTPSPFVMSGAVPEHVLAGWQAEFPATLGVPWLAISGRVLLYLAARLQAAAATSNVGVAARGPLQGLKELQMASLMLCCNIRNKLQMASVSQQLSAAGYTVDGLQQQLETLMSSLPQGMHTASLSGEQIDAVRSLGLTLTSQAFPCACNNPACGQLAGPLELQLVNGRSCMCAGCRVAHYCCRDCQRRHWKQHKPVCQAIAAAQAAAATAQGAAADAASQEQPASLS